MLLNKYSANWSNDFNQLKQEINLALNGLEYTIEHVGSTAVPNLDAKPIIDIDIVFTESKTFQQIKAALEMIGYYHNGNQGIEDREVFKRNGQLNIAILDTIKHHLYICSSNSKALERHLLSRDFLRKNEWARIKYQQIKYELANKANQDQKAYAALKELHVNVFIDAIVVEERKSF